MISGESGVTTAVLIPGDKRAIGIDHAQTHDAFSTGSDASVFLGSRDMTTHAISDTPSDGRVQLQYNKGVTLAQLAIFLATIAGLLAILTPLITRYIDQARTTQARSDVRAIASALQLYRRDTGQYPIYANAIDAENDTQSVTELVGTGTAPAIVGPGWELDSNGDMETYLNTNLLGLVTNNPARGSVAFRGPYVSPIPEDPWGHAYVISALNLRLASPNVAVVISAGPNGNLDTIRDQTGTLTVSGDDIAVRIN